MTTQCIDFFSSTTEDHRIAAFQRTTFRPNECKCHQEGINFVLVCRSTTAALAHVSQVGRRVSEVENLGTNQFVMQDDVGFADETQRFQR